jgi:hypothetical protein
MALELISITMSLYSIGNGIYYVYKKGNDIKKDYDEYKKYKRIQTTEINQTRTIFDKNNEIENFKKIE